MTGMHAGVQSERDLSVWTRLAAGAAAGTVGQTVAYPLDVVRRRMQVTARSMGRPVRVPPPSAHCSWPRPVVYCPEPGQCFAQTLLGGCPWPMAHGRCLMGVALNSLTSSFLPLLEPSHRARWLPGACNHRGIHLPPGQERQAALGTQLWPGGLLSAAGCLVQMSGWSGAQSLHAQGGQAVVYSGMVDCFSRTVREEGMKALFKVGPVLGVLLVRSVVLLPGSPPASCCPLAVDSLLDLSGLGTDQPVVTSTVCLDCRPCLLISAVSTSAKKGRKEQRELLDSAWFTGQLSLRRDLHCLYYQVQAHSAVAAVCRDCGPTT